MGKFRYTKGLTCLLTVMFCLIATVSWANLYLNILAVNGTDEAKEKEIRTVLPPELTAEDILDTDGLRLEYDVEESAYVVTGNVTLEPKETRTFKILIRDLWQFEEDEIDAIREQIEINLDQLEDSEYHDAALIKKQTLLQRLDFLQQEQARYSDNIDKRIDTYRVYEHELESIREKASSIKYWRSKPPDIDEADIFYFVIALENPTDEPLVNQQRNYLPKEVKPEHFVDLQGFDIRYDAVKERSYLIREEELDAHETKQYSIGVIDIWNIEQAEIDNLRERARYAYKFIQPTKYVENADFLMENIKENLDAIEASQAREKNISEHISVYRRNLDRLGSARKDVEALEELLEVIREELKRSKLENILKKIWGLRTLVDIAKSILKKPADQLAWNIIVGILIFVGILTTINYFIWSGRSKNIEIEEEQEEEEEQDKESE